MITPEVEDPGHPIKERQKRQGLLEGNIFLRVPIPQHYRIGGAG